MLDLDYKDVAEKYGGNKQKIAEAAALGALGPEGPLLAVAAGMYIDRMRAAQVQEQAPQRTVAQQVLAPQQPMQPTPPQGLGAAAPQGAPMPPMPPMPPQGAQPMSPMPTDAGAAPMAPQGDEMPMGMAMGGLADLPIPDDMFDEPDNGGYAGGGLVAFAGGGTTYDDFARVIPAQESGGDYRARNKKSGALGKYQLMPATAKALATRLGKPFNPSLLVSDTDEARAYQDALGQAAMQEAWEYGKGDPGLAALYYHGGSNTRKWGPNTQKYKQDILGRLGQPMLQDQDIQTAEGRRASYEDSMRRARDEFAALPDPGYDEALEYYRKERSPEEREKDRKYDMWSTLAQIGASMASTNSPSFLQAAGEAMAAALPGAAAAKKERDRAEREAVNAIMDISGAKRKVAKEALEYGKDLYGIEMRAEEGEVDRNFRAQQAAEERAWRSDEARKAEKAAEALAKIRQNPSDMESAIFILQNGTPEQKAALEEWMKMKQKYSGGATSGTAFGIPQTGGQSGSGAAQDQGTYLGTIGG